jgi:cell division protein ZapA (FtsZ GTPase activity inhibitor)
MTELEISIGGRIFSVACDNEEKEKVMEAASLINSEAESIQNQLGRLPESKMLLLSALIVADRLVDLEGESKLVKEKSDDVLLLNNKNKKLEQEKTLLQKDNEKLEGFIEKILSKLELVAMPVVNKADELPLEDKQTVVPDADQPKLF